MREIRIPIFPLPNVVFFPKVLLPLHIFEPRYRQMVSDAIGGDQRIGLVLLQEGWEKDYDGAPAVFPVGCLGKMEAHERLAEGRFNILLRGVSRFEITDFVQETPYRIAHVRLLTDRPLRLEPGEQLRQRDQFLHLFEQYLQQVMGIEIEKEMIASASTLEAVVNQVAALLDIPAPQKQQLLQLAAVAERYERLRGIIDQRLRMARVMRRQLIVPQDPSLN